MPALFASESAGSTILPSPSLPLLWLWHHLCPCLCAAGGSGLPLSPSSLSPSPTPAARCLSSHPATAAVVAAPHQILLLYCSRLLLLLLLWCYQVLAFARKNTRGYMCQDCIAKRCSFLFLEQNLCLDFTIVLLIVHLAEQHSNPKDMPAFGTPRARVCICNSSSGITCCRAKRDGSTSTSAAIANTFPSSMCLRRWPVPRAATFSTFTFLLLDDPLLPVYDLIAD